VIAIERAGLPLAALARLREPMMRPLLHRSTGYGNRGIFTRQDRPHYRLVLKLNHGVDEQVDSC
jgi:hypothetical protein